MNRPAATLEEIETVFMALSHDVRRQILLILSHLGGELPSGYLATRFRHSWPTTTRHLGVLEKAGLVEVHRRGRSSQYRINREKLTRVLGVWLENLRPPAPERTWAPSGPRTTRGLARRKRSKTTKNEPKGEKR